MKKTFGLIAIYSLPLLAFAQTTPFLDIVTAARAILDAVVPLVITLALIYFIYGVAKFITASESDEKEKARNIMIYGAIGLFVIVSIWGIIALLQTFTGAQAGATIVLPSVPTF